MIMSFDLQTYCIVENHASETTALGMYIYKRLPNAQM